MDASNQRASWIGYLISVLKNEERTASFDSSLPCGIYRWNIMREITLVILPESAFLQKTSYKYEHRRRS